jgi:hypothetical protein
MICNPYESTTPPYGGPFTPVKGQQVRLREQKAAGGKMFPGGFSLLEVPGEIGPAECTGPPNNPQKIACVLAAVDPETRCVRAGVVIRPGNAAPVNDGINARFDIYESSHIRSLKENSKFAPSANVTKGKIPTGSSENKRCGGGKNEQTSEGAQTTTIPQDPCFASESVVRRAMAISVSAMAILMAPSIRRYLTTGRRTTLAFPFRAVILPVGRGSTFIAMRSIIT